MSEDKDQMNTYREDSDLLADALRQAYAKSSCDDDRFQILLDKISEKLMKED